MENIDFATLLQNELDKKKSLNPSYSLRAFAKFLGVSASFLSHILARKRTLSIERFLKIAQRLNLDERVIDGLFEAHPNMKAPVARYEALEQDRYQWVAEWHHYAVLEAIQLSDFDGNVSWLADRLKIPLQTATEAVERLVRLGLLRVDSKGCILKVPKNYFASFHPVSATACHEHDKQVLRLALKALDQIPVNCREQASLTLALPLSRYMRATQLIENFRREILALSEVQGKKDAVFNLSISFYPVTEFKLVES